VNFILLKNKKNIAAFRAENEKTPKAAEEGNIFLISVVRT